MLAVLDFYFHLVRHGKAVTLVVLW